MDSQVRKPERLFQFVMQTAFIELGSVPAVRHG